MNQIAMDIGGESILIISDFNDGNTKNGFKRVGFTVADQAIGFGLDKLGVRDDVRKLATEAIADKAISKAKEVIINEDK